jgi:hypothetical protein
MKKKLTSIIILLAFLSISALAQVAMGKWRTHFAYNNVSQIAQSDNKIYAVSEGALFSVDKQDANGEMEFYSKLSGLNGAQISRIEFDKTSKQLLIVYINGNIDLLTSGGVINIPDLYNKQMSSSKEINQIQFYQDKAYLSCNFGIIVLNMSKKEVADTYYIGPNASEVKVLSTIVFNGTIYALTPTSIYKASITEPHLVNYEFWTTMGGLPGSGDLQSISSFSNQLILQRGGQLYKKESDNTWTPLQSIIPALASVTVSNFNTSTESLNVFDGASAYLIDKQFNAKVVNNIGILTDAEYDSSNNTYWFAANALGVISYKQTGSATPILSYCKPAGPAVNLPWDMTFAGKKLFVVQGGRMDVQYFRSGLVMMCENGVWSNIYQKEIEDSTKHAALDFENIAVDPIDNKHFFITSFGTGLYEFKNNKFSKWYTHLSANSTLETANANDPFNYIRLDGAIYDKNNNLFCTNIAIGQRIAIKILYPNGNWGKLNYTFSYIQKSIIPTLGKMLISNQNQNQKWIPAVRYNPGICIFDDNGTLTDQSDDKSIFIESMTYPETDNSGKTVLQSVSPSLVYCTTQDKNGVIWVGTNMGPFLFQNLSKVFDKDYTCSRVKIPRNDSTNLADYLLVNEKIKAIAIDGANRKWLGTESSGVYLMSENGQQTIQHFTVSNSPLLSNDILSIAINPVTGEVFFGTGAGIVSYQSDAGEAGSDFGNVYAYPNPVREGFTGVITITGLVENTQVKITDITGNLVCQTVSNGSIATWDGKDVHGRKVNTGIYLAMCTNVDGTQSAITKILVVN